MLIYPVKYTDFDGNEVEEKLMFHISKVEATRLDARFGKDGLEGYAKKIASDEDTRAIFELLYEIILMGYGVKSDDGKRFIKSPEKTKEFEESLALDKLFDELTSTEGAMEKFINNVASKN